MYNIRLFGLIDELFDILNDEASLLYDAPFQCMCQMLYTYVYGKISIESLLSWPLASIFVLMYGILSKIYIMHGH